MFDLSNQFLIFAFLLYSIDTDRNQSSVRKLKHILLQSVRFEIIQMSEKLSYQQIIKRLDSHPDQIFVIIWNEKDRREGKIQQINQWTLSFSSGQEEIRIESEEIDYPYFNYTGPCQESEKIQIFLKL